MTKCDACLNIVKDKRGEDGHDRLKQIDEGSAKPFAQAKIRFSYYVCEDCGTQWRYEDDKNDRHAGWTEQGPPAV